MTAIIALTLSTAALLLAAYGAMRIAKIVEMTANLLPHIANLEAKLSEAEAKLGEMESAYESAKELIEATTQYANEAAKREIAMQEGINAIMNYDAMSVLGTGGDKL